MTNTRRAHARAKYYGPAMLRVIEDVSAKIEREIVTAEEMSRGEVTDLLLTILEPLNDILRTMEDSDIPPSG